MKKYFSCFILVSLAVGALIGCGNSSSVAENAYYVSATGSDSNSGSITSPWKTIQYAANKLVAFDTLYIRKGTYGERVAPKNSGEINKYITYSAHPGEEAIIDGTQVSLPTGDLAGMFEISGKSYLKVSGLAITGALTDENSNGILVNNNAHHITIENNHIYNTQSSGIGVWNCGNIIIDGNEVNNVGAGGRQESITMATTNTFEVKNNKVRDILGGREGICIKDGSANGKVFKNLVYNVPKAGIYVDAWDKHTYNIEVFGNIAHNISLTDGFQLASEMGGLLENIKFYNNISYNNKFRGLTVTRNGDEGGPHPMKNISIINNTFYNNGNTWGGGIAADNPEAEGIIIRNNICSQNQSFEISVSSDVPANNVTVENNLIYSYKSDTADGEVRGNNYMESDPLFINAGQANFHLQQNSPAIDRGSAVQAPTTDFDGKARPQNTSYDIGAFEY